MSLYNDGNTTQFEYNSAQDGRPELLEARDGEHVWIVTVAYRVSGEKLLKGETLYLDPENITGVFTGCYVCEEPWSERLYHRKCKGEPKS